MNKKGFLTIIRNPPLNSLQNKKIWRVCYKVIEVWITAFIGGMAATMIIMFMRAYYNGFSIIMYINEFGEAQIEYYMILFSLFAIIAKTIVDITKIGEKDAREGFKSNV